MITIKVSRVLDDDWISDVLVTAFDGQHGSCWYWCNLAPEIRDIDGVERRICYKTEGEQWHGVRIKPDETGNVTLDGLCENGVWIDAETIRVGIQKILDHEISINDVVFTYIVDGVLEADAGNIDAEAADVIVQAGLFGQIIFG